MVIPKKLQTQTIALADEGHLGMVKLKKHLRERVWFPFMDKRIEQYVTNCFGYTLVSTTDQFEPIISTDLPSKEYILVVIDYYSRYIEIEIMTGI